MKTTSMIVVAGLIALMGISQAQEGKKENTPKKPIAPELLEKYDKDKDGKLSKEERAEIKKDKASKPKPVKPKKNGPAPEILAKYDKDNDGKLNKQERAEMKKDKASQPKPDKKKKKAEQ